LRVGVALAVAIALVCAAAAPAHATFPGHNGRIAFTAGEWAAYPYEQGYSFVASVNSDGSDPRVLAGRKASLPVYRPDGHMIAFSRYRHVKVGSLDFDYEYSERDVGIFVMRADGTGKRRLVAGPYSQPDWAPNGRRLVLTRTRKPSGIFTWQRGTLRRLTSGGSSPAWSPTGGLIAFTREDRRPKGWPSLDSLYLMRPDGTFIRRLGPGEDPEWSPSGRRIVFTRFDRDRLVYSIRPDGTGLRVIARMRTGFLAQYPPLFPIYSPSGRLVAYKKNTEAGDEFILTMRSDGRQRRRIFNLTRWRDLPSLGAYTALGPLDWQPLPSNGS
jgi:TolB protein